MLFSRRVLLLLVNTTILAAIPCRAADKSALNVIVITIDTLRADHLGCYGYKQIKTPNIDALAADGVRFEHAYTPVPVTLPAHTVIFTGTYPIRSGMHDFSANQLNPQQATLASVLKERGYITGAVIGSAVLDRRFGLNRGFDFYYDHFDFNRLQESNLEEMERPGDIVADQALEWLSQNYQKKFFLWMHLYDPHFPYRPPTPYSEEYASRPYDGEIAFADAQVGRLLRFLREKGLYENALIVLAGDHGESLGEHGEKTHGFFIYNATLHVPLIVHAPGVHAPGHRTPTKMPAPISASVSLADIVPTVLRILNFDVPQEMQGENLLPLLGGNKRDQPRSLYSETFLPRLHFNWSELRGVETANYHFIDAPRPELYDLNKDPGETRNLFSEKKAVAMEMHAKLVTLIREYGTGQELAQKTGLDPALMERLKSLGYAGFSGGGDPSISDRELADPKDRIQVYELVSDAIADSQHGRYEQSVATLDAALKIQPDLMPAHYLRGLSYYRLQEYPRSVEEFQRVLQLSPDYALAVYYLGLAYARNNQMNDAIKTLKHALDLDPSNFAAAYNLGTAYEQKQMPAEAATAFRQAVAISDAYAPGHRGLGEILLAEGQVDEAIMELRKAAELMPQDPTTHIALARALSAKGLNAEAEDEMRKAQATQPQ